MKAKHGRQTPRKYNSKPRAFNSLNVKKMLRLIKNAISAVTLLRRIPTNLASSKTKQGTEGRCWKVSDKFTDSENVFFTDKLLSGLLCGSADMYTNVKAFKPKLYFLSRYISNKSFIKFPHRLQWGRPAEIWWNAAWHWTACIQLSVFWFWKNWRVASARCLHPDTRLWNRSSSGKTILKWIYNFLEWIYNSWSRFYDSLKQIAFPNVVTTQ